MAPSSTIEFVNAYSKFVPEFDGTFSKLKRFLDALNFLDTNKETHEATAVTMIKPNNHNTIKLIHDTLQTSIKAESTKVLNAKLLNIKQFGKTPNEYAKEIEDLAHSLKSAYISEGLTPILADKYSTVSF